VSSESTVATLRSHRLELALLHPQIAPNVGNIGRLCVATGTPLHLVRPLGFVLSDARLKRAGLDYWPRLKLHVHESSDAFDAYTRDRRRWFFDSSGTTSLFDAIFTDGDFLILGSETRGVDPESLARHPGHVVRIPQASGERCLNLSTSAGIALYMALARVAASTA
jgi:tRNA (cytidine/uridine-2'-O-)-methyltransferase